MAGTVDLARRETEALELMDDPDCDPRALERTYAHFALVNRLVSGWRAIYRTRIRPVLRAARGPVSILDIGSGGGDVARALAAWAARDEFDVSILAIDPDPRAHRYATSRPAPASLRFAATTSRALVEQGERFDIVLSNHVLHHLDPAAFEELLDDSERLAVTLAVHNDIRRGAIAYRAYAIATTGTFRGAVIPADGLLSIRRSYRVDELRRIAPSSWRVFAQRPFRVLALFEPGAADA
jgi:2-polyprenyl-3-methyl-5-hydroxy-6-metoxy-1,4-benzoquinol methylase